MHSDARRRMLQVVHWFSLPFAVFCLGAPLWSLVMEYQRFDGKTLTSARVLSIRISSTHSRASPAGYEVDVRYPVGNHFAESHLLVTTFRFLKVGDTVRIFLDPKTGNAIDDGRFGSWLMLGWGIAGSAFFVFAGFAGSGKVLRDA